MARPIIDARDSGVVTTAPGPLARAGRAFAHGWPPAVELWRRDAAHRLGSLSEPLLVFPLAAWVALSAPLVLVAALLMWSAAKPSRFAVCAGAGAAAFFFL